MRNGPGHEQSSADNSKTTERAEASPAFDVTLFAVTPAGRSTATISMGSAKPSFRWIAHDDLGRVPRCEVESIRRQREGEIRSRLQHAQEIGESRTAPAIEVATRSR